MVHRDPAQIRLLTLAFFLLVTLPGLAQRTYKVVSGIVTDANHEPLKGAVVEVESAETKSVRSYITDTSGHYTFPRLDGDTDYRVWARFRGKDSKSKTVSGFETRKNKVLNLVIRLY